MKIKDILIIDKELKYDPSDRDINGENAGNIFYKDLLKPRFLNALNGKYILEVDLDGKVFGYPSSFVSESFGTLSKEYGSDVVLKYLNFKSDKRPIRIVKIKSEILNPS